MGGVVSLLSNSNVSLLGVDVVETHTLSSTSGETGGRAKCGVNAERRGVRVGVRSGVARFSFSLLGVAGCSGSGVAKGLAFAVTALGVIGLGDTMPCDAAFFSLTSSHNLNDHEHDTRDSIRSLCTLRPAPSVKIKPNQRQALTFL